VDEGRGTDKGSVRVEEVVVEEVVVEEVEVEVYL